MRAVRTRIWIIAAVLTLVGVAANLAIAFNYSETFDPVGDFAWNVAFAGGTAMNSVRYSDAERDYRIASAITALFPIRDDLRLDATRGLASTLWAQGRYAEALKAWNRSIQMMESEHGPNSYELVSPLIELADSYRTVGLDSLADATESRVVSIAQSVEPTYLRAVKLQESRMPKSARILAEKLVDLGDLYMAEGRADLAELPYARAVDLRLQTDESHKEGPIEAQLRLARADMCLHKYSRAAKIYRGLLPRQEAAFGTTSSLLVKYLEPLAYIEYARGDYAAAESLFERSLKCRGEFSGDRSPDLLDTIRMLARSRFAQSHFDDAIQSQTRAVEISRRVYGPAHIDYAERLFDLATIQADAGRLDEARRASREALEIFTSVLGGRDDRTIECRVLYRRISAPPAERGYPRRIGVEDDEDEPVA